MLHRKYHPIQPQEREEMKRLYAGGHSIREIAHYLSRSYNAVRETLTGASVKLRGRGGDQRSLTAQRRRWIR